MASSRLNSVRAILAIGVSLALSASAALAQLPSTQLFAVYPAGGKIGTTVHLKIASGADQEGVDKLHFSHPGITAKAKMTEATPANPTCEPIAGQFEVTIAGNVPPGVYEVRSVGRFGISNARAFAVNDRPELIEVPGNNSSDKAIAVNLGTIVNGFSDGEAGDWYKFQAKKGQRVLMDCWAQRIDSKMSPTLVVYDSTGQEIARGRNVYRRDQLVDLSIPTDGEYRVKVYDFVYAGGAEYFYRLSIGTGSYIDFIFPPAGAAGSKGMYTVYGRNLPGGQAAAGVISLGRPLEKLNVEIKMPAAPPQPPVLGTLVTSKESFTEGIEYRLPSSEGLSNPYRISFATAPVVTEQEPNNEPAKAQKVTVPCEYVGQFNPKGDQDWLTFDAKKGEEFWIEIFSQRLGLPTDPYVLVQKVIKDASGKEVITDVKEMDDETKNIGGNSYNTATDDPTYKFVASDDAAYRILARDLYTAGDARYVYRLSIRKAKPEFNLVAHYAYPRVNNQNDTKPWNPLLRRGGCENIEVLALRRDGFDGEIRVAIEGLPTGVTSPQVVIPQGQDAATVVVTAAEDAPAWAGTLKIVGKAKVGDQELTKTAMSGAVTWQAVGQQNRPAESRVVRDFALAVSGTELSPCLIELGENKTWEVSRAGKLRIPIKVKRRGDFKDALTLNGMRLTNNLKVTNMNIAANAQDAKVEFDIPANATLGEFTWYLTAQAKANYSRDPEGAKAAEEAKKKAEAVATQMAGAAKEADQAKQKATNDATRAMAEAQKATMAKQAADAALKKAQDDAKAAREKAVAAKAGSEKEPGKSELVAAKEAAEKVAAEAESKVKQANDAQAVATKQAEEAAAKAKAANDAKTAAEAKATAAAANAKTAADAKTAAEKKATDLSTAAKPKQVNLTLVSTPVTVKIVAAPITFSVGSASAPLKAGAKVELPVTIARINDYKDAVEFDVTLPGSVKGLKLGKLTVAAGQNDGKLEIEAAADATPGDHTLTFKAKPKLNNQTLQVDQTATLKVEAAAK